MARAQIDIELRPATLDDAEKVADLETARNPDEPRDPAMVRFWWTVHATDEVSTRLVAERNGQAYAFVSARHAPWDGTSTRFGTIRIALDPETWTDARYERLVDVAESWIREKGGAIGVIRVEATFRNEVAALERIGYREVRRQRRWELDLVEHRASLLAGAEAGRERMAGQGVRMLTLDRETDPDRLTKLYEMSTTAEQDIPTTVPMPVMSYDEWHHGFFGNPGIHADRFWIGREGDAIVGLSAIEYPPTRGKPWTAFSATARSVRGRGIARALKYQTVAQAIALGATRIRTDNDGENAPILHINAGMGYVPVDPVLELHRELGA